MIERRVVLFSNAPYFGGAENYLIYLARGLRDLGWDPVGLVPRGEPGEVLWRRLKASGLAGERFHLRHWMSPVGSWEIFERLRRMRGEVFHMNLPSPYEGLRNTVALWARLAGYRRVVATEHLPMSLRARRRVLLKLLLMPAVDAYIVMTRSGEEDLHRIHAVARDRIIRIPYGIDPAPEVSAHERATLRRGLGLSAEALVLAHVGRLTARKGHRVLLEAMARRRGALERLGAHAVLVGEGEEEANLREQVAQQDLGPRVHFLGHREDARRLIGMCDLLVLPSFMETQPFVILEAMAAGVPVLSTRIYGIPDMVIHGETGVLVPPGDAGQLGDGLVRLLEDSDLRRRMGQAGRRRFEEHFHVRRMAERTARVYLARDGVSQ